VGASPGKLPRSIPGHQGDLEGPRGSCQPRGASQILPGHQGDVEGPQGGHPALGSFLDPSQATRAVDPRGIPRAGTPGGILEEGASPGKLPKALLRPSGRPGGPSRRVPALGCFPKPFPGFQGDLEAPRGGCQTYRAFQAIRDTWRSFEVGASPGELTRPLSGHH